MINHQHTAFLGIGLVAILVQLTMHLQLLAEDPPTLAKVSRIPFETKFGLVTVKASLNNKLAGNFTVDSGASFCIVDERVASGLEIEPGMHITTLDTEEAHLLDLYHDVRLSIDGSDEQYVNNFSAVNLKRFVSVMGIPLHGVIGAPFFQNQRLRFDFDENVLSVGAGDLIDVTGATALQMNKHLDGRMDITVKLGSRLFASSLIDLGFNGGISLDEKNFDELESKGDITCVEEIQTISVTTESSHKVGRLSEVRIGNFIFRNVPISRGQNLIGLRLLSRMVVTFDVPNRTLFVEKGKQFNQEFIRSRSGIDFRFKSGRVRVVKIDEASPGEQAGIQVGDMVVSIDGQNIDGAQLNWLRKQLADTPNAPPRQVELTMERDGETFVAKVQLIDYSQWPRTISKKSLPQAAP